MDFYYVLPSAFPVLGATGEGWYRKVAGLLQRRAPAFDPRNLGPRRGLCQENRTNENSGLI